MEYDSEKITDLKNPLVIIAWGLGIALVLIGIGLLLKFLLPAVGAMIGITTSIIAGGIVSSTVATWILPAAGIGLAVTGGTTGIIFLVKVVKEAKKNPFEWTLPILAIVSALVIDICKELYDTDNSFIRIIYGASVCGLFLLGGILWKQKQIKIKWIGSKILSIIVFLTPPFLIYLRYCQTTSKGLLEGFKDIPSYVIGAIVVFIILLLIIIFLSWIFKEDGYEKA